MKPLTIALAKGALFPDALATLSKFGITLDHPFDSRRLSAIDSKNHIQVLQIRSWDVPVYVAMGAADFGIVGQDVVYEQQAPVLHLWPLPFGHCDLVVAAPESAENPIKAHVTVATKYPFLTQKFFQEKGIDIQLVKLYGAIEMAPATGLANIITDLSVTGKTLKENGLTPLETVFKSQALFIGNKTSFKTYYDQVKTWINA